MLMQTPMLLALGVVASVPVDGHKGTGLKGAVSGSPVCTGVGNLAAALLEGTLSVTRSWSSCANSQILAAWNWMEQCLTASEHHDLQ